MSTLLIKTKQNSLIHNMKIPTTTFSIHNTTNNIRTISCPNQNEEFLVGCLGCHLLFPSLPTWEQSHPISLHWNDSFFHVSVWFIFPWALNCRRRGAPCFPPSLQELAPKLVDPVFLLTHPFLLTPTPCYMIEPSFRQFFFFQTKPYCWR